jgi:DnaJ like chaperone protein
MTFLEGAAIVSGLAIGYWLVSVFLPSLRDDPDAPPDTGDGLPPGAQRDAPPGAQAPSTAPAWHVVLEVAPDASRAEIDAAYRRAIGQYHPDRVAHMGPEIRALAEAKSRQINEAYDQATHSAKQRL